MGSRKARHHGGREPTSDSAKRRRDYQSLRCLMVWALPVSGGLAFCVRSPSVACLRPLLWRGLAHGWQPAARCSSSEIRVGPVTRQRRLNFDLLWACCAAGPAGPAGPAGSGPRSRF